MMYNLLYSYNNNDDDFITAHSRAIFNPLIFKVLLYIPLSPQIYGKNSLKALSDPTLTKPNGLSSSGPLSQDLMTPLELIFSSGWRLSLPSQTSFILLLPPKCTNPLKVQASLPHLLRECINLPAPAVGTMEKIPRATFQAGSLSEHQFCIWDGFVEKVGFELGLTAGQIQRSGVGKGRL